MKLVKFSSQFLGLTAESTESYGKDQIFVFLWGRPKSEHTWLQHIESFSGSAAQG